MSRRVAVLGPGRVGTAVATALVRGGDRVVAVADGGGGSAARFAGKVAGVRVAADATTAVRDADTVLVTVPDDAIAAVVTAVAVADGWTEQHHVVHCSGAVGVDVLRRAALAGARVAACHPAQTVPANADAETLLGVPWAVTCAAEDRDWAEALVVDTGGDPFAVADGGRVLYHAALTLGANAVGAAVAAARQLLLAAGVEHADRVLGPLVEASVGNVLRDGAVALTGPVVRGDVGTVGRHLAVLDADAPPLADAYRSLQQAVLALSAPGRDPAVTAELAELLSRPEV